MNTKTVRISLGCIVAAAISVSAQTTRTQTVWDGVYTADQAARGKGFYDANCGGCHGPTLGGRNGNRALAGPRFFEDWGEDSLGTLYAVMARTMPRGKPNSLEPGTYVDIVAYILQKNDYPAGTGELTADRIAAIRVSRKEGPGPVPNFALIATSGCLSEPSPNVWVLQRASAPVRTRNPAASEAADRQQVDATPLGTESFELMDIYQQGVAHRGHRMEVKGLLIRGTPNKINITSIQMLSDRCE